MPATNTATAPGAAATAYGTVGFGGRLARDHTLPNQKRAKRLVFVFQIIAYLASLFVSCEENVALDSSGIARAAS